MMDENGGGMHMNERRRRHMLEILPLMVICLAMVFFSVLSALDYGRTLDEMSVLQDEILLMQPENEQHIAITLPEEFDNPRSICFYSVYQEVRVKLNGQEVYSFLKPQGEKMMHAAPSYWNNVALPGGNAGGLLEIELTTSYESYGSILPEVRSGTAEQAAHYIVMKTMPRLIVALAILFIGIVFSILAVIMRYYMVGNTGLYSLSLFVVVLAIFLATQQTTMLLRLNNRVSYIFIQHVALMLCPLAYSRYLMRVHQGKLRRLDQAIQLVSIVNLAVVLILQFATPLDMPQMAGFTRVICALLIVYEFIQELRRRRRLIICLFSLMMIYAVIRYYITDSMTWIAYAAIILYLYIIFYRVLTGIVMSQAKQIRLEAQLEVSKSEIATIQITSHFFYHTLDSIRALIRLDTDKAYKMTGDFAKYIRHRVDGVERMQETVPFSRELRSIRAYTDIKQAQLGERFEMIFDVETEDFEILPLTVQPLVENAVIHAVQRRREGGKVILKCREGRDAYHIEVIDNGPGPAASPEVADAQKQSTAIKNVNTRLEFYGIALPVFEQNELGGMTVHLETPKKIVRKGKTNEGYSG